MMPCNFITRTGGVGRVDLDAVFDVAKGMSGKRPGWIALVIYEPNKDLLIEFRDSPNDCAHGTPSEVEEVDDAYVRTHFGLSPTDLASLREHPKRWRLHVNGESSVGVE
jgi:hypothetical protein